jgi:hypothetical protein
MPTKSFAAIQTEERRLVILRTLNEAAGFKANHVTLQKMCDGVGLTASGDQIKSDIAWLAEQGLVESTAANEHITLAWITTRGADVAVGRARVPGVKLPEPGMD